MRKAFNFYRSYYEVAKELPEKDRLPFLWAILERQFDGTEPNLKGMSNFAYISQKHNIDSQVAGYQTKTGVKLTPTEGGKQGATEGGSVQVEDKGKEEGKGKVQRGIKIFFIYSDIFDKIKFKESFPDWDKTKLSYYYDSAVRYSNEGNKYIDWKAAIKAWAKKDELQGKLKFNVHSKSNHDTDGLL